MSHNYLNKSRTQELINTIRGHLSDIATVLSNLASGDARDDTKAPIDHTQASNTITAMTGYTKPQSTSAITASDTLNSAIGKLEKVLESAGGSSMISLAINSDDGTSNVSNRANINISDHISLYNIPTGDTYTLKTQVYDAITESYLSISKDGISSTEIIETYTPIVNNSSLNRSFSIDDLSYATTSRMITVIESLFIDNTLVAESISSLTVIIVPWELGIEIDFANGTFTRLGDAVGLNAGNDFNKFPMYKRRRCNLADDGTVNAYYGDANYTEDGSNGQVMVEQPKFYYKVVDNEYWISDQPLSGYILHPAFFDIARESIDYFYEGAYEGYESNSQLLSISNVRPTVSKRQTFRSLAANRGNGWFIETICSLAATQLLMIIEYGSLNMQSVLGRGFSSTGNETGTLSQYGNGSYGNVNSSSNGVQWRGKENPWGNNPECIDGINIAKKSENGYVYIYAYINSQNYSFSDNSEYTMKQTLPKFSTSSSGIAEEYISQLRASWTLLPLQASGGNSTKPVGDTIREYYVNAYSYNYWYVAINGKSNTEFGSGLFCWQFDQKESSSIHGAARLLYVG